MKGSAWFDPSGAYRYSLSRFGLQDGDQCAPSVHFVMLNPSTADANVSDPTVRRCELYATRWGFHALTVTNLFAFRSTDPRVLRKLGRAAIGVLNDSAILEAASEAEYTVCAWGAEPAAVVRGPWIALELARRGADLRVLGLTKAGQPRHPLYMRGDLSAVEWSP